MGYREQGERPPIPQENRRWYTKTGDPEKGPFEEDALVRSFKEGKIGRATQVRAEDEVEWKPIRKVRAL
jgi:hypothetical protein